MNQHTDLISIFLPYYNDKNFLPQAINSILAQTYTNWELFLVNHDSADGSRDIAHSFKDIRIKHIDIQHNTGAVGAILFDEFLKKAKGNYIKTFSADDVLLPHCFELLLTALKKAPEQSFCFGNAEYVNEKLQKLGSTFFQNRDGFDINATGPQYLKKMINGISPFPYAGFLASREAFDFSIDKTTIMMFDMAIYANLLVKGYTPIFIDTPVALYRIHPGQTTGLTQYHKAVSRSMFEVFNYLKIFLNIKNVMLLKQAFPDNTIIQKLQKGEETLLPFAVAKYLADSPDIYRVLAGRMFLSEIFNNDEIRLLIEHKFNYFVADFRKLYTEHPVYLSYREPLSDKNIPLFRLIYLLFRRIWNILTFRSLYHKYKENKTKTKKFSC